MSILFGSVQLLSCFQPFVTPWTAACQASLSITNSQNLLKLMSIESVMPSNHLILCCPLLLPPSIFLSIRVFSNESVLRIRWPKSLQSYFCEISAEPATSELRMRMSEVWLAQANSKQWQNQDSKPTSWALSFAASKSHWAYTSLRGRHSVLEGKGDPAEPFRSLLS